MDQIFLPGLRVSLGPGWWALVGLSCGGLVLAIVTGNRLQRILGLVGVFAGVVFLFTPQFLAVYRLRCSLSTTSGMPMLLSFWDSSCCRPVRISRRGDGRCWVLGAYMAILVATQFDAGIWPTSFFTEKFRSPGAGIRLRGWPSYRSRGSRCRGGRNAVSVEVPESTLSFMDCLVSRRDCHRRRGVPAAANVSS